MPPAKREMLVGDAAKRTGISRGMLEKWMRDAFLMKARPCPFGDAVFSEKGEWQYYIYPLRLKLYLAGSDLILTADRATPSE